MHNYHLLFVGLAFYGKEMKKKAFTISVSRQSQRWASFFTVLMQLINAPLHQVNCLPFFVKGILGFKNSL
ncbi:hypothetical protein SORBI_3009G048532 [Sorghum bicolor]|uniref:Uncharacterized protein n=1 Tax=Sorghum bicolor TaxID=4558 RepID=A0A1Z5R0X6_SORBI|nr:hypothetical protein SORBI_3009G048532 [Sorghum bicolor]